MASKDTTLHSTCVVVAELSPNPESLPHAAERETMIEHSTCVVVEILSPNLEFLQHAAEREVMTEHSIIAVTAAFVN